MFFTNLGRYRNYRRGSPQPETPMAETNAAAANPVIAEQAAPAPASGDVWLLVAADMESRRQHGIEKYGVPVQVDNGRDPLIDAYQEALDLVVYLRQEIEKRRLRGLSQTGS